MDIDAFILVGGRSSRFGSDKANAELNGKPLLEITVENIRKALDPPRITLVAANDKQLSGSVGSLLSLPFIFDQLGFRGPVGAIHAALANARTKWAFIIACDYPFISADLLERLAAKISADVDAVAPVQPDGRVQPLVAFYRVAPVLKAVEEALSNGKASPPARIIFDKVRPFFLPFETLKDIPDSGDIFLNMNTPKDFQRAVEIYRRRLPI